MLDICAIADICSRMDAHDGQAAWAQFFGSIIALAVAIGLGAQQARQTERARKEQTCAYMAASCGAAIHARLAILEADVAIGAGIERGRTAILRDPSLHSLAAAEAAILAIPLHAAPNDRVVRHMLSCARALRQARGAIETLLASDAYIWTFDFSAHQKQIAEALDALNSEQKNLTGQSFLTSEDA